VGFAREHHAHERNNIRKEEGGDARDGASPIDLERSGHIANATDGMDEAGCSTRAATDSERLAQARSYSH